MAKKQEIKKRKRRNENQYFLRIFGIVSLTLIFVLLCVFFTGRAVANGSSEDLRSEFYSFLEGSPFAFAIPAFFGDEVPETNDPLPECFPSDGSNISVVFPSDSEAPALIIASGDDFAATIYAIKNPTRLFIGESTQLHNDISSIMTLENASIAFSASDAGKDKVLCSDGILRDGASGEFFGITDRGIMVFGNLSEYNGKDGTLQFAKSADISALISNSVPCNFSPSDKAIGKPALAIGQCADGSLIILFTDRNASCADILEIFYRYSAVNAAIIYVGEDSGIVFEDGTHLSYGDGFEGSEFASAWMIK